LNNPKTNVVQLISTILIEEGLVEEVQQDVFLVLAPTIVVVHEKTIKDCL
jgi:hypothetical protein